jgi:dipeptidyl aminopeptidase/acylaminoacyl peptidase
MGRLYSSHVRTVKSCRLALAVLLVAIVAPQLDAQESRTVLDGTVVLEDAAEVLENTEAYRRDLRRPEYGDERDSEVRAFLESISPTTRADEITSALFVVQGANDPRVPASESEQIAREVRANGQRVWTMTATNEGHGFAKKPNQDLMQQLVVLFLEEHLLRLE